MNIQRCIIVIVQNTTGMNCLEIDNGDEKEDEEVEEKAEEENEITKGNRRILRCPTVSPYGDTVGHQSVW